MVLILKKFRCDDIFNSMFNLSRLSGTALVFLSVGSWGLASSSVLSQGDDIVSRPIQSGTAIAINGEQLQVNWLEWQDSSIPDRLGLGISDLGLMESMGVELLDTDTHIQQPISWFASSPILPAQQEYGYRYLDITALADQENWQVQIRGNLLDIKTPPSNIEAVETDVFGDCPLTFDHFCRRFVIKLDRPTPWQRATIIGRSISPQNFEVSSLPPGLQQLLNSPVALPGNTDETNLENEGDQQPKPITPLVWWSISLAAKSPPTGPDFYLPGNSQTFINPETLPLASDIQDQEPLRGLWIDSQGHQTRLIVSTPPGWEPVVSSSADSPEITVTIRPDFWTDRNILWAKGLRWRQEYVHIPSADSPALLPQMVQFPVVWLEIDLTSQEISLEPIFSRDSSRSGLSPLVKVASDSGAVAAINGGFFNRNNQLPLGAIRHHHSWLSGPILNRGAIAWTDQNQFQIDRLELLQTLIPDGGEPIPLQRLNSAYIQPGLSRYTSHWGRTYTPFGFGEVVITVVGEKVISHQLLNSINFSSVPIPTDGYLLVLRNQPEIALALTPNTSVELVTETKPIDFAEYPHSLGGGPLLLLNNQIVLDPKAENFSDAFNRQRAIRSAVGLTSGDRLLLVVVHQSPGGTGPSLADLAALMKHLGAIDALNLDGGSSSGLYLGGYLLDRHPQTAAPINNALGVFLPR